MSAMPWWIWLALGATLLVVEVAVQTEFWLAVLGVAALIVGAAAWMGFKDPLWAQWAVFGMLSIFLAVVVRRRIHSKWVASAPGIAPELVGERVIVDAPIPAGRAGGARHRGSVWKARNVGDQDLDAGVTAIIQRVEGTTLEISTQDSEPSSVATELDAPHSP